MCGTVVKKVPYVVAIMSSHGVELQRRAARTEPEWTFADLYSSLLISDEYQVLDIKICSNGKTEWVSVELLQPTKLCTMSFSEWRGMKQHDLSRTLLAYLQSACVSKMHFLWSLKNTF